MKKILSTLILSYSFFVVISQQKLELINSGEVIRKGIQLHDDEKYDEAIAAFLSVPSNDTNYVLMLAELINTYITTNKDSLALIAADEGMKYDSEYEIALRVFKANALDNLKRFDEAIAEYDKGQKDFPRSHVFYYEKGVALLKKEKYKEAHDLFVKTIQIDPYYHPAHFQMGNLAVIQGKYIPAMLAWQYYLMLDNKSKRASRIVNWLEQLAKVEYEFKDKISVPALANQDDFSELESIVKSKVALSDKYKSKLKLNYAITKQIQLICEKLSVDKSDEGFYAKYYAPFFIEMTKNKFLEAGILAMFSGVNSEDVIKAVSKKKTDIEKFSKWAENYLHINHEQFEDKIGDTKAIYSHYYSSGNLSAIGNIINNKNEGYWNYFKASGKLKSEGLFKNDLREGFWKYYYTSGSIKEKSNFKNGISDGEIINYYESGGIKSKLIVVDNHLDGKQETFHAVGTPKGSYSYINGKIDGKCTSYFLNGKIKESYSLMNEKVEGEYIEYSSHGRVVTITRFKTGLKEGLCEGFYDDDKKTKSFEGKYVNDKIFGKWNYYHDNGNLQSFGEFNAKGLKTGIWIENYQDGKMASEEEYIDGELNGSAKSFAKNGKVLEEFIYKKNVLQQFKQFDAAGNQIASGKREKKELNLVLYHENGNKRKEGRIYDNIPDGEWKEFDVNGNLKSTIFYKQGVEEGAQISYHENGAKSRILVYKNGQLNGLIQDFTETGKVIDEGYYVDGLKQGQWNYYTKDGTIKNQYFYLDGDLIGWQKHYGVKGKIYYEDFYQDGFMKKIMYYDTLGNIFDKHTFTQGSGDFVRHNLNGKDIYLKGQYKAGMAEGEFKFYFIGDKISSITPYINDEEHGKGKTYNYEGILTSESDYFEDLLHGKAIYYFASGKMREEINYVKGTRHGMDTEYYENGKVKSESPYENDQINGETKLYSEDGNFIISRTFLNGRILSYSYLDKTGKLTNVPMVNENGKYKAYFTNGNTSIEGEYINGLRNGVRKIYHSNGKLASEENYINGNMQGKCTYYYNSGKIKSIKNYNLGDDHGSFVFYYENGKIEREEFLWNDEEHGTFKYFSTDGKLTKTRHYYNGVLLQEKIF